MRITNNMLSTNLMRNIQSSQSKLENLQNQLSSFHRVNKPSDDPAGVENIMHLNTTNSSVQQWKKNADQVVAYMSTTDNVLGDVSSMLSRIKELAVQGSNDTASALSRNAIAQEIDQISQQLQDTANTKVGTRYIFAGTQTNQKPIVSVSSAGVITPAWAGNSKSIDINLGDGVNIPTSVDGKALFDTGLFTTLAQMSSDLKANLGTPVGAAIDTVEGYLDNFITARTDLGARVNRISTIGNQLDSMSINITKNVSSIQDADMAQTMTDFQSQQNVYQAALSVGAKIIQPSLVDYIK